MEQVPRETWSAFERRLERAGVPAPQRPGYHKWVRFYLDFCHKYGHPPRAPTSLGPFVTKLASKNQSVEQRNQAALAVRLLTGAEREPGGSLPVQAAKQPAGSAEPQGGQKSSEGRPRPVTQEPGSKAAEPAAAQPPAAQGRYAERLRAAGQGRPPAPPPRLDGGLSGGHGSAPARAAPPGRGASWEQEYRDLEGAIRLRNYSNKTLAAYRLWVRKFQAFLRKGVICSSPTTTSRPSLPIRLRANGN